MSDVAADVEQQHHHGDAIADEADVDGRLGHRLQLLAPQQIHQAFELVLHGRDQACLRRIVRIFPGTPQAAALTIENIATSLPIVPKGIMHPDDALRALDSGANAIDVLANDNAGADAGETLSVTSVTQGAHGSVSFTATGVSYTDQNARFLALDVLTVRLERGLVTGHSA